MIKKVWIAYKGTRYWLRALDFARKREYYDSKQALMEMEKIGVYSDIEYCLFRGFIEYMLTNNADSDTYLHMAINKIDRTSRFSHNEKLYLRAYAQGILNEIGTSFESITFDEIELNEVESNIKDKFPLTYHPEW